MSVALRGNLQDFGIADIFQLIGQQRKTGVLEFTDVNGGSVQLRFDRGAVVSAAHVDSRAHEALGDMLVRCGCLTRTQVDSLHTECEPSGQSLPRLAVARGWITQADLGQIEDLLTLETIFEILRWSDGSFDFRNQQVFHDRPLETLLGAEQILMDGLRMVDEWQTFADFVPSQDVVFERVQSFQTFLDRPDTQTGRHLEYAKRVYGLVDGRLKVRRVIDLSRLGSFDATRALAVMCEAGVIAPLDLGSQPKARRPRPKVLPRADARSWAATLIPLLLLGAVAFSAHSRSVQATHPTAVEISGSVLDLVRDDYATLRVSHALEAYRLGAGSWPDRLFELSDQGILPSEQLASEQGRPYYYAKRADGAVLLAPER